MIVATAPAFTRDGVVGGFVLGVGAGLVPTITKGVLFANGVMYRPGAAPVLPGAPANAFNNLYYQNGTGFYWADHAALADDAFVGWAVTDGSTVLAVSAQQTVLPDSTETTAVIPIGLVQPAEATEDGGAPVNYSDLVQNGRFDAELAGWYGGRNEEALGAGISLVAGAARIAPGADALYSTLVPCRGGDAFRGGLTLAKEIGTDGQCQYVLGFADSDRNYIAGGSSVQLTAVAGEHDATVTAPAGAAYVYWGFAASGTTVGAWLIDEVWLHQVVTSDDIQKGSTIDGDGSGGVIVKLGALSSSHIQVAGLGDLSKFGANNRPVAITVGLPLVSDTTNYPTGTVIFNTSDSKVYRIMPADAPHGWNRWWKDIASPDDLIAGNIGASVAMLGTVLANQIQENGLGIAGTKFSLNRNGKTVTVSLDWDAAFGSYAGLKIADNTYPSSRTIYSDQGFACYGSDSSCNWKLDWTGFYLWSNGTNAFYATVDGAGTPNGRDFLVGGNLLVGAPDYVYDHGFLKVNGYYLWVDGSGKLRIKYGLPANSIDGTIVGTQS